MYKTKWNLDLLKEKLYGTAFYDKYKDSDLSYQDMREILHAGYNFKWDEDPKPILELVKLLPRALELHPGQHPRYRQPYEYRDAIGDHIAECKAYIKALHKINAVDNWKGFDKLPFHKIAAAGYRCLAYETYNLGHELADCMLEFFEKIWHLTDNSEEGRNLNLPFDLFDNERSNLELPRRRISFHVLKGKIYKLQGKYKQSRHHYEYYYDDFWYYNSGPMTQNRGLESALEVWEFDKDPAVAERVKMFYERVRQSPVNPNFEGVVEALLIIYMLYEVYCGKQIK